MLPKHAVQITSEQESQHTQSYGALRDVDHTVDSTREALDGLLRALPVTPSNTAIV